MNKLCLVMLLVGSLYAQTVNTNILPATTGLDLGSPTQQWDAFIQDLTVSGLESIKNLSNVRFADQYTGADWCAKVTAADTDLGSSAGEIWVSQLANVGGSCSAAPTLSTRHSIRFIQGGVYQIATGWTIATAGYSQIVADERTFISFTGSSAFTLDGSAFGNDMQDVVIKNIVFSGNASVANACTIYNVARSYFENVHCINATTRGMWLRAVIAATFVNSGNSVNMFSGSAIPELVVPATLISFDENAGGTSATIGISGNMIAECGTSPGTTGVSMPFLAASNVNFTTVEGCDDGVVIGAGSFDNTLNFSDIESNAVSDLAVAGTRNRITLFADSPFAPNVSVTGANNVFSGSVQGITLSSAAIGTRLVNFTYSVNIVGGVIADSTSPKSTCKLNVQNGHTGAYDDSVLNCGDGVASVVQDNTATVPGQFVIHGATNSNQQLIIGYNTASDYGAIEAIKQGTGEKLLKLNPTGGGVSIGAGSTITSSGVGGTIASADTAQSFTANQTFTKGITMGGTAATLTGTGSCGTRANQKGGATAGEIQCTGTTGASTLTITTGVTAVNGWSCWGSDTTTAATGIQTTRSTTAPVLTFSSVTANDYLIFGCVAY